MRHSVRWGRGMHLAHAVKLRQQVVAGTSQDQLALLERERLCRNYGAKSGLERREHGLHQAAPVVRPLKLFGVLLSPPEHLCPRVVVLVMWSLRGSITGLLPSLRILLGKTAISYRNGVRQPRVPPCILEKSQGNANNTRGGPVYSCICSSK